MRRWRCPRGFAVGCFFFLAVLIGAFGPVSKAQAQEEDAEATAIAQLQALIDSVDPIFGEYVVNNIAAAFLWDMVFWDNGLSRVNATSFGPEGALYTGGEDGLLSVWKAGLLTKTHDLGAGPIRVVAAHPERPRTVAVGLSTGDVWLVDVATGNMLHEFEGLKGEPTALAFDRDGERLFAGSSAGMVVAWTTGRSANAKVRSWFRDPEASIRAVAVSSSTTAPAVAWSTSKNELFVASKPGEVRVLAGHRRGVGALAFAPEGVLGSGGDDGRVLLHSPGAIEPSRRLVLSEEAVVDLAFPHDDQLVVGRPGAIQVLELRNDKWGEARSIKYPVVSIDVDPDGVEVAATRSQGQAGTFELATGQQQTFLAGHATEVALPFIVVWLVLGAIFFTFRFGFVNIRAFLHAIDVTRGKYDGAAEDGDVSHFQALAMALSATVGLGNIAGVAVAVGTGGPGAVFWMIIAGFLGMSSKFAECTLGQMYRVTDARGKVSGGPMHYLKSGLQEMGLGTLGRGLSILFAVLCIFGSLGGGNMFQANQSYAQVASVVTIFQGEIGSLVYGLILSGLVGVVIIGGIDRIGQVASLIVPFMVGIYIVAAFFIVGTNLPSVPGAIVEIVRSAFTPGAAFGGAVGVMVTGFRRAAFSNEAGVGSASIAHSAAATKEPVREGIVALLEPFIDTIVVCTTTALVIVITGAYKTEADGVVMTSKAFETVLPWFPVVLTFAVFLFAFSTMISWSYYGERCWTYLFGDSSTLVYRVIFVMAVVLGSIVQLGSVLTFSDLMILAMAFPNIFGAVLLSGKVRARLNDYLERLRSGAMRPTR